jgi:DNA-3-methyladenine glycosylase II
VSDSLTIEPRGPFSLAAAAGFAFGPSQGPAPAFDGAMRLAFPIDGGEGYAGVVARQPLEHGPVQCEVHGGGDLARVERQTARVLSLDHDGDAFLAVGERDRVIGELQGRHPGQRPVLFHSPYEAAAWSVISARRQPAQAAAVRRGLGVALGQTFELAGQQVVAFPQPERLLEAAELAGLGAEKSERLRAISRAALEGALDVASLHAMGPQDAWSALQNLPGIGPFYAGLIVLRAAGFADAPMPMAEPRILAHVARFYGLPEPPTLEQFSELALAWRPFRTWTAVLLRLVGDREFGRDGASRDQSA